VGAVPRPVATSELRVEAPLLLSPGGAVVTLLNWRADRTPVAALAVNVTLDFTPTSAESILHGAVALTEIAGGVSVTVPLDKADFLLFRR
jgi:hypothetical protein